MLSLTEIYLANFRNYKAEGKSFAFLRQLVFIIGANGLGKSNLLDGIKLLAGSRFGLPSQEEFLVNRESPSEPYCLAGRFQVNSSTLKVSLLGGAGRRRAVSCHGEKLKSLSQLGEQGIAAVSFKARESVLTISGGPEKRREWLDELLSAADPLYSEALLIYEKALAQRNRLLREAQGRRIAALDFEIWEEELARQAKIIQPKRQAFCEGQATTLQKHYYSIAGTEGDKGELVSFAYSPQTEAGNLAQGLAEAREKDIGRGSSSLGPHRDNIQLLFAGIEARHVASQGQQRTLALSLLLLQVNLVSQKLGHCPLILLDDVLAELDEGRQGRLLGALPESAQVFFTLNSLNIHPERDFQVIKL